MAMSTATTTSDERRRVLIVDDEPDIVLGLRDALEFESLDAVAAATGAAALQEVARGPIDLVILDLMLPDTNGYAVCSEIRARLPLVPIIMLTAKGQEADKVRGLESGADDYVTKPFSVAELMARIRAIFRRLQRPAQPASETLQIGSAVIDTKKQVLRRNRRELPLTFYEVEILKLLYERQGEPVSRDEILDKIWGVDASPTNRTVDNFIVRLRKKVEDGDKDPRHILTVYGQGYKLVL